ncbi:hypothetical protein BT63DRAFT_263542 [Microthyrium microscopicum]|uniref:Uncharacterized protein n=1 Tax=Microthyrium microscopicum TaxID=703497 RepID=A0A6A6UDQ4_9PEZI|nr:hypothetical protein BT63DRAFT_263542 [Microthyrium microscopicum]
MAAIYCDILEVMFSPSDLLFPIGCFLCHQMSSSSSSVMARRASPAYQRRWALSTFMGARQNSPAYQRTSVLPPFSNKCQLLMTIEAHEALEEVHEKEIAILRHKLSTAQNEITAIRKHYWSEKVDIEKYNSEKISALKKTICDLEEAGEKQAETIRAQDNTIADLRRTNGSLEQALKLQQFDSSEGRKALQKELVDGKAAAGEQVKKLNGQLQMYRDALEKKKCGEAPSMSVQPLLTKISNLHSHIQKLEVIHAKALTDLGKQKAESGKEIANLKLDKEQLMLDNRLLRLQKFQQ